MISGELVNMVKLPPYISALLLLPLNEYSWNTYIFENAILSGQVHTYFGGSERSVFGAYKYELQQVTGKSQEGYEKSAKEYVTEEFKSSGLKVARQNHAPLRFALLAGVSAPTGRRVSRDCSKCNPNP